MLVIRCTIPDTTLIFGFDDYKPPTASFTPSAPIDHAMNHEWINTVISSNDFDLASRVFALLSPGSTLMNSILAVDRLSLVRYAFPNERLPEWIRSMPLNEGPRFIKIRPKAPYAQFNLTSSSISRSSSLTTLCVEQTMRIKTGTHQRRAILHDWDETCYKIMRNCYNALPEEGKLLVVEILALENSNHDEDLFENVVVSEFYVMLLNLYGKDRTAIQYNEFARVG
ncbi:hypothetical protein SAY87_009519 [Trapa incisa]|uniref:O-methyltransferase C-terminal domain-containing protein n=1 Tax=Trapa incisa TaxID=236973 RepID=A0AAN7PX57_9MYRT|nr:hypothetical protein SAY87_009519 [Trapa incisa]